MGKRFIDYDSFVTVLKSIKGNDTIFDFFLHALEKERFDICEALLDAGVSINITKEKPKENLIHAVVDAVGDKKISNEKVLDFLLNNGIDINFRGSLGTPLYYACSYSNVEMVKYLIGKGAKVTNNPQNELFVISDLFTAVTTRNFELVKLLLESGAVAEEKYASYGSPLSIAFDNNDINIVELLLKYGASPNFYIGDRTLLHKAVCNGNINMVELLLLSGADVNAKFLLPNQGIREYDGGSTPIDIAVYQKKSKNERVVIKTWR